MKKRLVALLLVLVLIVPCAFASGEVYYRLKKSAKVWQFPNYKSRVIDTYKQDWALTISKKVDKTWAKVLFTNGQDGYIERSLLKRCTSSAAWVSKDDIKVRRGPNYTYATLYTVSRGDKVTVITSGAAYSYIKTDAGYGYIEKGALSSKQIKGSGSNTPTYKDVNYTAWAHQSLDRQQLQAHRFLQALHAGHRPERRQKFLLCICGRQGRLDENPVPQQERTRHNPHQGPRA